MPSKKIHAEKSEKIGFIGADIRANPEMFAHHEAQMFPIYDQNIKRWLPRDLKSPILDFGCGYGVFLSYLRNLGFDQLTGFDIDSRCVEFNRGLGLAQIEQSGDSLEFLRRNSGRFQMISCFCVAPYIGRDNLLEWFQAMASALKPGGLLLVEVPNAATVFGSIEFYNDPFMKSHFTDVLLRDLATLSKLEILALQDYAYPVKTLRRHLWLKSRGVWTLFLRLICLLEKGSHDRNPKLFGQKIFLVAKRPESSPS